MESIEIDVRLKFTPTGEPVGVAPPTADDITAYLLDPQGVADMQINNVEHGTTVWIGNDDGEESEMAVEVVTAQPAPGNA